MKLAPPTAVTLALALAAPLAYGQQQQPQNHPPPAQTAQSPQQSGAPHPLPDPHGPAAPNSPGALTTTAPGTNPTPQGNNPLPPGHPAVAPENTPGGGGSTALPPGHPAIPDTGSGDPHAGAVAGDEPNFRQMPIPQTAAAEAADLAAGTVNVRVLDATGRPQPEVLVRLGAMRDGEHASAREARSGPDGVARFEGLDRGSGIAYRASVENDGARFSAPPFVLPTNVGYRVQIVRFDVEREPRSVLINDARVEVTFADDRLVVVQRVSVVNFSNMSLDGHPPHPVAFVPGPDGLRFRLPAGYSAFRVDEESMGDQKLVEQNGYASFRGSIPPTGADEPIQLVFQYRVKVSDTEVTLNPSLPLPVLRATVVAQQPMHYVTRFTGRLWPLISSVNEPTTLEVEGMPAPQERSLNGQRIVITGRERRTREDPPLDEFKITIRGIPPAAGPERDLAAIIAVAIVLAAAVLGFRRTRGRRRGTDLAALRARKTQLLADAAELSRAHRAGDVGPETYARRKREIAHALADVLKALAEPAMTDTPPPAPSRATA